MDYDHPDGPADATGRGSAAGRHRLHLPLRAAEGYVLRALARQRAGAGPPAGMRGKPQVRHPGRADAALRGRLLQHAGQ